MQQVLSREAPVFVSDTHADGEMGLEADPARKDFTAC
jgi:hypothetical protein